MEKTGIDPAGAAIAGAAETAGAPSDAQLSLPARFEEFGNARKEGFLRVKELKENGGRIAGTFCTFTPLEILDAAGFTPVSLCGMSDETIPDAEAHLPKNLCPLIKSSYGFAVSDKCPYTYFSDLIVGETTCDGKKKMYELLGRIKPVHVLHLPQGLPGDGAEGDGGYALDMWVRELRRFIAALEGRFGVTVTEDALRAAARERNEERRARLDLMRIQRLDPPPALGMQLYTTLEGAGFLFDTRQRIERLESLRRDLMARYDAGERPVDAGAKRILVTGCPIGGVLQKTVGAIERDGRAAVVCFENCSGIKAAFQMVDADAPDIVGAIARRYLQIGCSVMTPNARRAELLRELVREYRVDGIVEVDLQSCTPYTVESWEVRGLAGELGVPYLSLETDYSQSDRGQLETRVEAFLEML